jgi:hypothetical protein
MTETEWLNAYEPQAMLEFLIKSGRTSERKLRLFAAACSRRVWTLIDPLGRAAVEVAEKHADRLAGPDELRAARLACRGTSDQASWYSAATIPENAARNAARSAQVGVGNSTLLGSQTDELLAQANLVRDIFDNPFRPLNVDRSWRTPAVVALAQAIYEKRVFDRMPELAEVLEAAGCNDPEILNHCRGPAQHVRGCFLIDRLISKE